MDLTQPFIVTLQMDNALLTPLDALRRAHFPANRNFLRAHITLFHALPGDKAEQIKTDLQHIANETPPLELQLPSLRFLGKGVAINVSSVPLLALRDNLAKRWQEMLTHQDQQKFSPHVTIQNKVDPATARQTFQLLSNQWTAMAGLARGLDLWRYQGGPWAIEESFLFERVS